MLDQLLSLAIAAALFPLFIIVPGAVVGALTNVFEFRRRAPVFQLCLSLCLSFGIVPIINYLVVRAGGFVSLWAVYGVLWIVGFVLLIRSSVGELARGILGSRKFLLALAVWFVVCSLSEIDLVFHNEVFLNLNTIDAVAHVAFTDALTRTGVPPTNPFVYPGKPVHLFYYYLWYLVCSLVDQLGGVWVTARAAVQAGVFYIGFGVAAVLTLCVELFGERFLPRKPQSFPAAALLLITGLDVIPWILLYLLKTLFDKGSGAGASIEWWNEQVTAWVGAVLMSPHHPAGIVICFTGLLLVFDLLQAPDSRRRLALFCLLAVTFASGAGVSFYVTFTFGAGLGLWLLLMAMRGKWLPVLLIGVAGAVSIALYLPFAMELKTSANTSSLPLGLTIRAFEPVDYWLPSIFKYLKTPTGSKLIYVLRFIFLPVNYFLELGFFLVSTWLYLRWRRRQNRPFSAEELLLVCLAAASVLICTFLRSTFRWNDLGWRGFLVAQMVFLFWAVPVAQDLFSSRPSEITPGLARKLLWFCLFLGVTGSVWEIAGFRIDTDRPRGEATLGLRDAYKWINHSTPKETIVLFNPNVYLDFFSSLYGYRQVVIAGKAYGTFFAVGDKANPVLDEASAIFAQDESREALRSYCERYHVGAIVVGVADPVWNDRSSWVWSLRPSFETATSRVFLVSSL